MAITAMGIIKIINNHCIVTLLLIWVIASPSVLAGDWQLNPILKLDETFSDNVELTSDNQISSYVTQTIAGINAEYNSNLAYFKWSGTQIYAFYSHDSSLNDNFRTLDANGQYRFWDSGLTFTANANIANVPRNNTNNSYADLISGDTVQTGNYSTGLQYDFINSSYSVNSSVNYNIRRAEDNIGEYDGFNLLFGSQNGNTARYIYWQLNGDYTKRNQLSTNNDGENYTVEALLGAITSWNLNPFIRYYDENVKGTGVGQDINTTSSWGPGIRWLATPHIIIDLSYNFVADETVSDDYFDTSIQWEPSARTSLTLGYSQRFFGNSYNLEFTHKTRRLTNSITYNESLEVFDRNSYQEVTPGDLELIESNEVTPGDLELIESNEFALNKRLSWSSQLQLSRTLFGLSVSSNERTSLETNVIDDTFITNISVTRIVSPRSSLSLSAEYNYSIYDKDNPAGSRQEDYYRIISANYTKNLASNLSAAFTLRHLNRDSNVDRFSYDEVRAMINITKEF